MYDELVTFGSPWLQVSSIEAVLKLSNSQKWRSLIKLKAKQADIRSQ